MKILILSFFLFITSFISPSFAREFYVGGFTGYENSTSLGIETETYDSFISYVNSTSDYSGTSSSSSSFAIGYLFKDQLENNFTLFYGGTFGLLNLDISGNSYSGSAFTILTGVGFMMNDQVAIKLLVTPFSTGEASSTASGTSPVKVSNMFSTLIGISYYYNK